MKTSLQLLVGVLVLLLVFWLLAAALGLFRAVIGIAFWAGLALAVGALVLSAIDHWRQEREARRKPSRLAQRRAEKAVDRALNDLKREVGPGGPKRPE